MNRLIALAVVPIIALAALVYLFSEALFWLKATPQTGVVMGSQESQTPGRQPTAPLYSYTTSALVLTIKIQRPAGHEQLVKVRVSPTRKDTAEGGEIALRVLSPKPAWIFWSDMARPHDAVPNPFGLVFAGAMLLLSIVTLVQIWQPTVL